MIEVLLFRVKTKIESNTLVGHKIARKLGVVQKCQKVLHCDVGCGSFPKKTDLFCFMLGYIFHILQSIKQTAEKLISDPPLLIKPNQPSYFFPIHFGE